MALRHPIRRPLPQVIGARGLPWDAPSVRRGSSGGGGEEVRAELTFSTGLSSVNHWRRVADGPPGSSDMSVVVIWRQITAVALAADMTLADRRNTNGWRQILAAGSGTRLISYVEDGASATKFAITAIGTGITQNKANRTVLTLSGGVLRHFHNGVQQGSDVAVTGYSPATTEDFFVGKGASTSSEMDIAGVIVGSAMSVAEVATYDAQLTAGGAWSLPGTTDYLYDAADISGTSWAPQVGSGTLTAVGTPGTSTVTADWE